MSKTRDVFYAIFVGMIMFLAGSVIIGGTSFLLSYLIGIDFISVLLYFFVSKYITRKLMDSINTRGKFYSIIFPVYTALMYIVKEYIVFLIIMLVNKAQLKDILLYFPTYYINLVKDYFVFDLSVGSAFSNLISLLLFIIEILIMGVGIYNSYRITKIY